MLSKYSPHNTATKYEFCVLSVNKGDQIRLFSIFMAVADDKKQF